MAPVPYDLQSLGWGPHLVQVMKDSHFHHPQKDPRLSARYARAGFVVPQAVNLLFGTMPMLAVRTRGKCQHRLTA